MKSYPVILTISKGRIDGIDYQILIEADFLVNASESNFSKVSIENAKSRIFKTAAGCRLLESIFLREE